MEKRLFLAMVLTALVLVGIPRLFSPPRVAPIDTASTAVREQADSLVGGGDTTIAPSTGMVPRPMERPSTPAVIAETTSVTTPLATFQFGTTGASLLGVELTAYRALSGAGGQVQLARLGEPLIRYRLLTGGDTVPLHQLVFDQDGIEQKDSLTELTFRTTVAGGTVTVRYSIMHDNYVVRTQGTIVGLRSPSYLLIDLPMGLRSEEADSVEDQRHLAYAYKPALGTARGISFASLDPQEQVRHIGPLDWVVVKNKYFLVGLLTPGNDSPFQDILAVGGSRRSKVATHASAFVAEPVTNGQFAFEIYAGPQEYRRLLAMGRDFQNANPYGGWLQRVVQPFATIVMQILLWMRDTFRLNYGWVLVIFGVVVRLVLWPLNQRAMRASLRMQQIQPQLQEVQRRYQDNPEKQRTELMRVYKEHDMTPLSPMLGCLPMLLPMPILFALFFVFQNTIEFRGVSFLWLPDISLKDPFYIVPVLMGLSMFVLSWIGIRNAPPNPQAKLLAYFLPVMMTVLFLNFASGLNLYYAVQNIAALPQQWLIANERAKATPPARRT
jgi:YidC/Oxa1 family membrane protein insertase